MPGCSAQACSHWQLFMPLELAIRICGPLSRTTRMPGHSYSLPAVDCPTGRVLANNSRTVCHYCYARRGRYCFPAVRRAMQRRLQSIQNPAWPLAVASLIYNSCDRYFRWHDSGDLMNTAHLQNIVTIARLLPRVRFWLPTREYEVVERFRQREQIPDNLCVRYSAHLIDGPPSGEYGMPAHTVSYARPPDTKAYRCPAASRGNRCGSCRACWDPNIPVIDFPLKLPRGKAAGLILQV